MSIRLFLTRYRKLFLVAALFVAIPLTYTLGRAAAEIYRYEQEGIPHGSELLDAHGGVLARLGDRSIPFVSIEDMPDHLIDAVIAAEDTRFWRHRGIDMFGIARAAVANFQAGERLQGGSTITQQAAKNLFLYPDRTFVRKLREAVYALLMEFRFSKEKILELYLNEMYFGEGAYGIGDAAQKYFRKKPSQLTLEESAMLAALLRAPSAYSPFLNPELAKERRSLVLKRMDELSMIDVAERLRADESPLPTLAERPRLAPYFADYVRAWLVERFGAAAVFKQGFTVQTTLDPRVQNAAERALGGRQGAIVAVDPQTGHIKAMVGGRNYSESQFNRAVHAVREPGSAFKPFLIAAALERGWMMNDLVEDRAQAYGEQGDYSPKNFGDQYWETVTMKHMIVESLNNGAVWLAQEIGIDRVLEMARRLGISTLTAGDRHLAATLGGLERGVTPLEMASAYAVFAAGGRYLAPAAIIEVRDQNGHPVYRHQPTPRRVLSEQTAFFVTDILQDAVIKGTGRAADIGRPQGGKTGTTNDRVNAWFVGYTPELSAAVYAGEDDRTPLGGGGGSIAAPIWNRFMKEALSGVPLRDFPVPAGVERNISIDVFTGLLADENCRLTEKDSFPRGRKPKEASPCTRGVAQPPFPSNSSSDGPTARLEQPSLLRPYREPSTEGPLEPAPSSQEDKFNNDGESLQEGEIQAEGEAPRLERSFRASRQD